MTNANGTNCGTCEGTRAVARDGGFDACPECNDDPVPVPVDEEPTVPVEDETMEELVFGRCSVCEANGVEHIPAEYLEVA